MTLGEDCTRSADHGCVRCGTVRLPAAGLGARNAGAKQDRLARGIHAMHRKDVIGEIDFDLHDAQGPPLPSELMRFATPSWHSLQVAATRRTLDWKVLFVRKAAVRGRMCDSPSHGDRGQKNARNHCSRHDRSVACGIRQFVHHGRTHSYPPGHRCRGDFDSRHSRSAPVTTLQGFNSAGLRDTSGPTARDSGFQSHRLARCPSW